MVLFFPFCCLLGRGLKLENIISVKSKVSFFLAVFQSYASRGKKKSKLCRLVVFSNKYVNQV